MRAATGFVSPFSPTAIGRFCDLGETAACPTAYFSRKMGLTGQTQLLLLVAFVHLPFSLRSLDLFVASLLFIKGASYCVVRRK